jgi:ankyrin repeat protein
LSKGADANESSYSGDNMLELACYKGDRIIAALLFEYGASVEKAPKALLRAARQGSVEIIQMLLDRGADINAHPYGMYTILPYERDDEGWGSALHCAVKGGHLEAVRFLLEKGIDKGYKNPIGLTALDLAKKTGHDNIIRLLE